MMKRHLRLLIAVMTAVLLSGNTAHAASTTDSIRIADFWVVKGEQQTVGLQLTNAALYTAFQCDIFLPEGLALASDDQGVSSISLNGSNAQSHLIDSNILAGGGIRVVVMSMSNVAFASGDAVATITVNVGSDAVGQKTIRIENVRLVTVDNRTELNAPNSHAIANVVDQKSIITVKNTTREYGDNNPVFEFSVEGPAVEGTPEITCEATPTSAVGSYDIVINPGSIKNTCVTYVNGVLTITKAPLKVSVEDVTREQYLENPEFVIVYTGWKVGDDESVLTKKPVATTTATKDSPVGEYDIVVSGGEAQNYELSYENGVLTVTESTGITLISVDKPVDIYTTQGYKVCTKATTLEGLPKGVYIVNGRKVVVN